MSSLTQRVFCALLFVVPRLLPAQPVQVNVIATTPTQAIVRVTNSNSGSCFYRISEGSSFTAPVNDVNPILFPGSDSDARPGSTIDAAHPYVVTGARIFVAGTRTVAKASDGKFYSRALQANTQHWVGVTCGINPEVSTTFTTTTPPLGNSYPELPNFDPTAFGNHAAPTIDFMDKSKSYIDPLTGVLIKRVTSPLDWVTDNVQKQNFDFAIDLSGNAWSNIGALTNPSSNNLATISTPNAPVFLSWKSLQNTHANFDGNVTVDDIRLRAYCSSPNGGRLQACLSLDSGTSCASDSIEISCPAQAAEVDVPSSYPAPMFSGWGAQHKPLSTPYLSNAERPTVNVSGNTVTWISEPRNYQFYTERALGSRILIPGTAPGCPNNLCTVASIDTPTQITVQQTANSVQNAAMQDLGGGVLVWLKNTGSPNSVSANFTFDYLNSQNFLGYTGAGFDACSSLPITDIQTDKDGNPYPNGPKSGYLCALGGVGNELFLWIPETGEARLMSSLIPYVPGRLFSLYLPESPFLSNDPKSLWAGSADGHFWKGTLNNPPGIYKEYVTGATFPPNPDPMIWTDISAATPPIESQLSNFPGVAASALANGLLPPLFFWGVVAGYPTYISYASGDNPCVVVHTSGADNKVIQIFASWDKPPLRWAGCHFNPESIGTLETMAFNSIQHYSRNTPLGGPFTLEITQLKRNGIWYSFSAPITAATNASPVVFTSPASGLDPRYNQMAGTNPGEGPTIRISGGTGAWAGANGTWQAVVNGNDPNHFSVPGLDSTSFGPLTGNLSFSAAPPLIHSRVQQVSTSTPALVTISVDAPFLPQNHELQTGDPIGFSNLDQSKQYYAKVGSPTTFQVYSDPQLTQAVSSSEIAPAVGGFAYFVDMCPAGLPAQFTTNMPYDTGAIGPRCITVRLNGEPCSLFAGPMEHASLPCKADPNNTGKSSLSDLLVGDAIRDIGALPSSETLVLVKKVKNSENDIEATFMRWYGNKNGNDTHVYYWQHHTHPFGWTPLMVPSWSATSTLGFMDVLDTTNTMLIGDPRFVGAHGDTGYGNAPGLITFAAGGPDSISNKTVQDFLATPLTFTHNDNPVWANAASSQLNYANDVQSYPGHRQLGAPPSEHVWKGDWRALNPGSGNSQSAGLMLNEFVTLTKIGPWMYKINNIAGSYDRKRTPTYAWAGKWMFRDKSGPNSLLTSSDAWNYCVADNVGECQPGSAKNDTFLVMGATALDNSGHCWTNIMSLSAPCFTGANPQGGWAVQQQIDPIDTTGNLSRRLTLGFTAPGMHWTFQTWVQTPGGKWGFFTTPYVNGLRTDYFAMKLPPWPGPDSKVALRSNFVPVTVTVGTSGRAPYARARFGYAENGPVSSFFCTSRQEACSTEIPIASPGDPYSFVSEQTTHQPCQSGTCTIQIPGISGRIVYYVIDELDRNGNPINGTRPIQVQAVP